MRKHLGSKTDFSNWLTTMYVFYLVNRVVDFDSGVERLPEIHAALAGRRDAGSQSAEPERLVSIAR
jgi:hypothetical protein